MDKAAVEQLFVEVEPSQQGTEAVATATIPAGQHSTEPDPDPHTVIWLDINATATLTADRAGAGADEPQPEPSQVMKEHLQRRADAEAHFKQGETVRSRGKRSQSRSPKNRQPRPYHQQQEQEQQQEQRSQQLEMSRREHPNLEQEIDQMIERTLDEHKVAAHHMDGLRNYLRAETQRDQRVSQLVRYQHEERLRMQQEFDRQQKLLIQEICAEMDLSVYSDASSRPHSD